MRRTRVNKLYIYLIASFSLVIALLMAGAVMGAGVSSRISTDQTGVQGNSTSSSPAISADGRFVVFVSNSTNFVNGDTIGKDVFIKDIQTGAIQLVSTAISGNNGSTEPSISADGRFVAFASLDIFVPGDTLIQDVFIKDTQTGAIQRVSAAADGTPGDWISTSPSISADGRFVAFQSQADNLLVPGGGYYNSWLTYLKDTQTGAIQLVSITADGTQVGLGLDPSISADGRFVAFRSDSNNLVPENLGGRQQVFIKDIQTGAIQLVSTATDGTPGNYSSYSPSVSADGRFVAFHSGADNLVPGDTNASLDVFVKDTQTGAIQRVSTATDGTQGNNLSSYSSISADGRFVAFNSQDSNLVPADTNGVHDIFVKDTHTGVTTRISVDPAGNQSNGDSGYPPQPPAISADGKYVVFASGASNLVPGDTNGVSDIFLALTETTPPTTSDDAPVGWQSAPFTVTLSCTDDDSGCKETWWRVDGGSWATGDSIVISTNGDHLVEYYSVDNAGNVEEVNSVHVMLDCVPYRPDLALALDNAGDTDGNPDGVYWRSYDEFLARHLTVQIVVTNNGAQAAQEVWITGAVATNGVTLVDIAGAGQLGLIPAGSSRSGELIFHVPMGPVRFMMDITATAEDVCGNSYAYPWA